MQSNLDCDSDQIKATVMTGAEVACIHRFESRVVLNF